MTQAAEKLTITDAMRANWAVAYAMQHRTRYLSPALRRAYGTDAWPEASPDPDALLEARKEAASILAALNEGCRLMGLEIPS